MTDGLAGIRSFDLSPDGTHLLVAASESGRLQPWLLPTDHDTPPRELSIDGATQRCVWRPDGSRFAVQVDLDARENYCLAEMDPDTGEVDWIAAQPGVRSELGTPYGTASSPYSPDSRYLAFATNRRVRDAFDIVVRDLASGSERTVLTSGEGIPEDRYFPIVFSPDAKHLLVVRLHQNTEHQLYLVDLDSGAIPISVPHDGPGKVFPSRGNPRESMYVRRARTTSPTWPYSGHRERSIGSIRPTMTSSSQQSLRAETSSSGPSTTTDSAFCITAQSRTARLSRRPSRPFPR